MNAVMALCHFCEQHGPRIVYTTQSVRRAHDEASPSDTRRFYGDYEHLLAGIETMGVDEARCAACTSSESLYPCHLSNDHLAKTSYIGSQWPYSQQVYAMLSHACLRSLSCEKSESGSAMYFGDREHGYVISHTFQLADGHARGYKNLYSMVILAVDRTLLMNSYDFLTSAIVIIVDRLQQSANLAFKKTLEADENYTSTSSAKRASEVEGTRLGWLPKDFLRNAGSVSVQPRSLAQVTGLDDIFNRLHRYFVWIQKTQTLRCVELVMEGNISQDELVAMEMAAEHARDEGTQFPMQEESRSTFYMSESPPDDVCRSVASSTVTLQQQVSVRDDTPPSALPQSRNQLAVFDDLTKLLRRVNAADVPLLLAHLVLGDQVCIVSDSTSMVERVAIALAALIPTGCARVHGHGRADTYKANLVPIVVDAPPLPLLPHVPAAVDSPVVVYVNASLSHPSVVLTQASQTSTVDEESEGGESNVVDMEQCDVRARVAPVGQLPTIVHEYMCVLLDTALSLLVYRSASAAVKESWMARCKLVFQYTRQHPCASSTDLAKIMAIAKCQSSADQTLIKFWQGGLSRRSHGNG